MVILIILTKISHRYIGINDYFSRYYQYKYDEISINDTLFSILNVFHSTIWVYKMISLTSLQDRRRLQFGQAISQYFIVNWEGYWSGIILFILVCFVLFWCCSCVYNTNKTMKTLFIVSVSTATVLDLLIKMISTPSKILYVLLVTVTILHTIKYLLQGYQVWSLTSASSRLF